MTATHRHRERLRQRLPSCWFSDYRVLPLDLAAALRRTREERGWSLRGVARVTGIDPGYLSRLERGLRCPRSRTAEALILVLGLDDDLAERLRESTAPEWGEQAG